MMASKKKKEEEVQPQPQQQTQQQDNKELEKLMAKIDELLAKIQDIYSQVGSLQKDYADLKVEIEKIRKMLYWHRQTTEEGQKHSKSYNYYKKKRDDK